MKLIHTSDWHLGQEFYSFERIQEHESFLSQLEEIVRLECPDVLVISGDIFHNATPSNAVMRMFTDYLDSIRSAYPLMKIVVIAGNHDSSSRLEVSRTLWSHLGVYVIGKIEKNEDGIDWNRHIIPIKNTKGQVSGYVVALPFVPPQAFPSINEDTPRENRQHEFLKELAHHTQLYNTDNLPVVMMAHMAVEGCDITGHDNVQGGMEYLPISEIQVDYDYLALGHIHCPQIIKSSENTMSIARYCGSPVAVNFDENYVHSVTVVDIEGKGLKPVVRTIPIQNPWPLKTLPDTPVSFEEAIQLLETFPDDEQAYIRLYVRLTDIPPHNAMERAHEAVANKRCRFCCFKWEREAQNKDTKKAFADVEQMKAHSPLEIADLYYENKYGHPLDSKLKEMLAEVIREVQTKQD